MKLSVGLNRKSIKNAVKSLETAKKQLVKEMVEELLISYCVRIIHLANENLDKLDLGDSTRRGIQSSWLISEVKNGAITLTNDWHKQHGQWEMASAYVEFGVGVVGENTHPEASEVGYQYNMPSSSKDETDTWYFYTNDTDLDLPRSAIDKEKSGTYKGGRLKVATQGTQATRFLYNAVMDFDKNNEAQKLWQEIKARYWG